MSIILGMQFPSRFQYCIPDNVQIVVEEVSMSKWH